ncbi:thioredoxin family protein [Lentiprolixibacter aurantiacus]|uniref:Thioredoxin family protein n=1 Tax=Lentiprolixibacter aurantiacus TaxID=2993939 RepID=A0AAE3MID3_9FLAO|nr:thioredoxin family protein [Lentiprolixibacter aurantiacus]MCX2718235.1 thioredoxin family protein [Lentiprolixibacter aurantiacus]
MTTDTELKKEIAYNIRAALPKATSYEDYRKLVLALAESGDTTGDKTVSYINYTLLNNRRMKRWDKTLKITDEQMKGIKAFSGKVIWLVLTESWCGDAAHTIPAMNKIAELNPGIDLKILQRDEHPKLMDHFLTNGARSIPKLIMLDANSLEVKGEWGPRPAVAGKMVAHYKKEHGKLTAEFREELQNWYNKDKGQETFNELITLLALENVGNSANL